MKKLVAITLGALLLGNIPLLPPFTGLTGASGTAHAMQTGDTYSAAQLLSPCQEADNDARWGAAAEAECEQYIVGFVDGLREAGVLGTAKGACPPAQNTPDEVRWAYMRWIHADYTKRSNMSASRALMATLKSAFPCKK